LHNPHYIAVVPLSAVRLAAITNRNGSECNDLTPPMTLKSGYYVSSKPGDKPNSPHWFILLTTDSNGNTSGTIAFVDSDRRPRLSQTFTGHSHSDFAVLTFSEAGLRTASYESAFIDLENCWDWLNNISSGAQCVFSTRN
jgi:hypothetical protein